MNVFVARATGVSGRSSAPESEALPGWDEDYEGEILAREWLAEGSATDSEYDPLPRWLTAKSRPWQLMPALLLWVWVLIAFLRSL